MATLYVRNFPDDLKRRINVEAARRGCRGQTEVVVEWLEAGADASSIVELRPVGVDSPAGRDSHDD